MDSTNRLLKLIPRSLVWQTLGLLALTVLICVCAVGPWAMRKYSDQYDQELERRGRTTVQALEKHSDLRLAISLADPAQAAPILRGIVDSDEDIRYVAVLGPNHAPIAYEPSSIPKDLMLQYVAFHFTAPIKDDLKRFTQAVTRSKDSGGLDFGSDTAKNGKDDTLGYVVLALSSDRARSRARVEAATTVFTGSLLVYTGLILIYFLWVARRLNRMRRFAEAVATGELRLDLDEPIEDDIGRLSAALRLMSQRTGAVVTRLVEASRQLSAASADLFESSSRQASNASKQAASVSEMGATVAELRETFNQATTKAESVIDLARRSEESSSGGAEAVRESIEGMGHIRDQVVAISQTIQGLVQRTDQIDAIIDVVNDLAEQSNVLALNAGIEAARAGEHGRGFAVVAREVRSLAERSKESTAQVRAILQDIKLAGREAVRAIDEGSRRAETGMTVANAAGEAIRRLGDAIAASSAAAMQIASSTRQQSVGVEQIWQATKEIDRIATETANGIQQLEAAAGNMKSLSGSMAEIVGRYKIDRSRSAELDRARD